MNINKARNEMKLNNRVDLNRNTSIKRNSKKGYVVHYHANGYTRNFTNFKLAYAFAREESTYTYMHL